MVFAACRRILGNRADAEDAAQDCFFRLARNVEKLRPPIAGWLHTVAVRVSLDALRKRSSARARQEAAAQLEARKPPPRDPTWDEVKGAVDLAIAQLPDKLRVPLVLYYLEQRTQEDIARELAISQPAVSQRLKRAVGALRRRLKREGYTSLEAALAPLLAGKALEAAPATLTAALGKMALAGIAPAAAAPAAAAASAAVATVAAAEGAGALAEGLTIGKAVAVLTGVALIVLGLALLVQMSSPRPRAPRDIAYQRGATYTSPGTSAAAPTQPAVVVLNPDGAGTNMFLDLDTGRRYSLPPQVAMPDDVVAWMREHGADVLYAADLSGEGLLAVDMMTERLGGADSDAQAAAFFRRTARAPAFRGAEKLDARGNASVAYAYRTREGGAGVLEVSRPKGKDARGMVVSNRPAQ